MLHPTEQKKIFVYGSLRTGFYNYNKYLKGKIEDAVLGKVKGKLYHMPHKGYDQEYRYNIDNLKSPVKLPFLKTPFH